MRDRATWPFNWASWWGVTFWLGSNQNSLVWSWLFRRPFGRSPGGCILLEALCFWQARLSAMATWSCQVFKSRSPPNPKYRNCAICWTGELLLGRSAQLPVESTHEFCCKFTQREVAIRRCILARGPCYRHRLFIASFAQSCHHSIPYLAFPSWLIYSWTDHSRVSYKVHAYTF